jgi:hypothetical protein
MAGVCLRHAAALALVGWYLMLPPMEANEQGVLISLNLNAPISKWDVSGSYDSPSECRAARARSIQILKRGALRPHGGTLRSIGLLREEGPAHSRSKSLSFRRLNLASASPPTTRASRKNSAQRLRPHLLRATTVSRPSGFSSRLAGWPTKISDDGRGPRRHRPQTRVRRLKLRKLELPSWFSLPVVRRAPQSCATS